MRALAYISLILLLILGSCSSTQYAGSEYDDLYYSSSDQPVVKKQPSSNAQIAEQNLNVNDYYDNMYAVDTLVSDQFSDATQKDAQVVINNNYGGGYDYYDSYSGRLNNFYGNYFNPYWQDPYYFSPGYGYGYGYPYSGMSFGFGFGYPYFSLGFSWGYPYYPYYGYGYGGYYPPYYGGYYPVYGYEDTYVNYGRRERPSTISSRANLNASAGGGYTRRDPSVSSRANSSEGGRSYSGNQTSSNESRRTVPYAGNGVSKSNSSGRSSSQAAKGESALSGVSSQQGSVNSRPEYKNSNRTYLPSYNNPRMSTRPSYNNSRTIGSELGTRSNSNGSYSRMPAGNSSYQSGGNTRSNPSFNSGQKSSVSHPGNAVQYSVPARRSSELSGSSSSGSYSRSSSGYSGGSRSYSGSESRSSYSSGSSSYSSGGSSGYSSGGSASGSSHSSSGRR